MLAIRKASERGVSKLDWLESQHSFSFGHYQDSNHMGFSALRVINEDLVIPGAGFGTHGHRDMEIISYVIAGELAHKDSMGTGSVIRPGDVQRMSAGTGVTHSEMNASQENPVHFLQIWILPERKGLSPGYEQKHFAPATRQNQWRLVGSQDGREGSITIHQNVNMYAATLSGNAALSYPLAPNRQAWIQVVKGAVQLAGEVITAGDGVAMTETAAIALTSADADAEVLLFDFGSY